MDRLFLDANILFSAAYRPNARLRRLWELADAVLITSTYAVEEARVNLKEEEQLERLDQLVGSMRVGSGLMQHSLPEGLTLRDKDQPILSAAIAAGATHLLTGDVRDIGLYFDQTISGVLILPPAAHLQRRS